MYRLICVLDDPNLLALMQYFVDKVPQVNLECDISYQLSLTYVIVLNHNKLLLKVELVNNICYLLWYKYYIQFEGVCVMIL